MPERRDARWVARDILAVLALVGGTSAFAAQECIVPNMPFRNAKQRAEIIGERQQFVNRAPPAPFQFFKTIRNARALPERAPAAPCDKRASSPFFSRCKEVAVEIDGRSVQMRVLPSTTQQQAVEMATAVARLQAAQAPLGRAIDAGDHVEVRRLLSAGADPNGEVYAGAMMSPPLLGAAMRWKALSIKAAGNAKEEKRVAQRFEGIIKALVERGADPARAQRGSTTVIQEMPKSGLHGDAPRSVEAVQFLLQHGARIDFAGGGIRPLAEAAARGDVRLVKAILGSGHPDEGLKVEALFAAVIASQWKTATYLLENGADPRVKAPLPPYDGRDIVAVALASGPPFSFFQSLLQHGGDPNVHISGGRTPLMEVIPDHAAMEALLRAGANPNMADPRSGETALHLALVVRDVPQFGQPQVNAPYHATDVKGRAESVALLLRYGASPDARTADGYSPLMVASPLDEESINLLLDAGARVIDTTKGWGLPPGPLGPITWALSLENDALARAWALRRGVDDPADCSAAYRAAAAGHLSVLKALVEKGANLSAHDPDDGALMFHAAAAHGHESIVRLLLDKGAFVVDGRTKKTLGVGTGKTALMFAAFHGRVDMIRLLLARGAEVNAVDSLGYTALDYALPSKWGGNAEAAQVLQSAGGTAHHPARMR